MDNDMPANDTPSGHAGADPRDTAADLRQATLASGIGSALEYFDFALYGLATALIFNKLFFTNLSPATGTIAAFATYGVGFAARPLGGLFFGRIGDRMGRKWVLVVTILLMGGSSTLVGALPTYRQVGVLAPILLVVLRLLQGFGAGAEQAGSTVLMSEFAPVQRRGYFAALPFVGIQGGTLLASLVFIGLGQLSPAALLGWAWRIPFLCSILLMLVALLIRNRLRETPTFVELEKREQITHRPLTELVSHSMPGVLRGIGLRMAENGGSYLFQTLAVAYAAKTIRTADWAGTVGVALGSLIGMVSVPLAGHISDRLGRRTVYRAGAGFMLVYAFPAWWMLSLGNAGLTVIVIAVGISVAVNTMLGAQCALLPELFGNRHRYLGVAVGREVSAVLAGGLAGVLGAVLIQEFHGAWFPLGLYLFVLSLITFATTFVTPETRGRDLLQISDASTESAPLIAPTMQEAQ